MVSNGILRTSGLKNRLAACVLVTGAFLALSGCDQSEKTREMLNQRSGEAQKSLDAAQKQGRPVDYNPLTVTNKLFIARGTYNLVLYKTVGM